MLDMIRPVQPCLTDVAGEGAAVGGANAVLVVDSYAAARRALGDLLRECGVPVLEASHGIEGLRLAREHAPALVVTELWPFFSGALLMMEALRAAPATRRIPVLVMTSQVGPECRARALTLGCVEYLEKPCAPEAVITAVRRALVGKVHVPGALLDRAVPAAAAV